MTFDLPNLAAASFPEQARLYSSDLQMLTQTASLTGTKSGCAVTAQGSPNMTLAVASGEIYWQNTVVAVTAGNVTITTAHATLKRIDLVCVNSSGTKSVAAGTAAAIPVEPAIPANSVVLAQVFVPAADTAIGSTQIKDRRIVVQVPSVLGGSNIVRKTTAEAVTSSTTLQDDNELFFAMTANTIYQVQFVFHARVVTGSIAMKFNFAFSSTGAAWNLVAVGTNLSGGSPSMFNGSSDVISTAISGGASGSNTFIVQGVVFTASNAGNFRLQWAQNASSATAITLLPNSYVEYRPFT